MPERYYHDVPLSPYRIHLIGGSTWLSQRQFKNEWARVNSPFHPVLNLTLPNEYHTPPAISNPVLLHHSLPNILHRFFQHTCQLCLRDTSQATSLHLCCPQPEPNCSHLEGSCAEHPGFPLISTQDPLLSINLESNWISSVVCLKPSEVSSSGWNKT